MRLKLNRELFLLRIGHKIFVLLANLISGKGIT